MKTKIDKVVLEMVKLRAGDAIEAGWDERARAALKEHQAEHDSLVALVEAANDLANDVQTYFDSLAGKITRFSAPEWAQEQVAKSLRIYQSAQAGCSIKAGLADSNFGLAAVRAGSEVAK